MRRAKVLSAGLCLGLVLAAAPARAQTEVSGTIKGTVGCGLIGAELPLMVESIIGVQNGWILGLSALGGAAGGAVLGWLVVEPESIELSVGSLVVGMALVIPTIGLVVNATSYRADDDATFVDVNPEDETQSESSAGGEATDGGGDAGFHVGGSTSESTGGDAPAPPQHRPPPPRPLGSLLSLDRGALALSLPSVGIVPTEAGTLAFVSIASGRF